MCKSEEDVVKLIKPVKLSYVTTNTNFKMGETVLILLKDQLI